MLPRMRALAVIACVLAAGALPAATVYKNVQPDGTVIYSDIPSAGAEEIDLPEIQFYTAPRLDTDLGSDDAAGQAAEQDSEGYDTFAIASPENDATLRDNAGNVSISLEIQPALRAGHQIDIRLDGTSIGRGSGTSVALTNVDRGTHTVQALVLDGDGREVASTGSVTFHLRRATKLLP